MPFKRTRLPNEAWPKIVDQILDGATPDVREAARSKMWVEVVYYITEEAKLPIGPLRDDDEARRNIAMRVLERLESQDYQHLRTWRKRQRAQQEHSAWWRYIQVVAKTIAIDVARGSRENTGKRGEHFRWTRVMPVDPFFLRCTQDDLREYLAWTQSMSREDPQPSEPSDDGQGPTQPPPGAGRTRR